MIKNEAYRKGQLSMRNRIWKTYKKDPALPHPSKWALFTNWNDWFPIKDLVKKRAK